MTKRHMIREMIRRADHCDLVSKRALEAGDFSTWRAAGLSAETLRLVVRDFAAGALRRHAARVKAAPSPVAELLRRRALALRPSRLRELLPRRKRASGITPPAPWPRPAARIRG
jgi:hypothetical protein